MRIEELYAAATRTGLLVDVEVEGQTIAVDFRSPDESVLGGLALTADYTMRYPATVLPTLTGGSRVSVGGNVYRVREIRSIGDGSECRASLTRL